jgi:hypothetical protein
MAGKRQSEWLAPSRVVFVALLGIALLQALIYYPQLPDRLASHFDAAGHPNGWSSKSAYFALQGFILLVATGCFAALPVWLERAPIKLVNLPNRDYWLSPERRVATMARVASALTWFGCAALVLMVTVTSLVIRFNLGREPVLPAASMWALVGAFPCAPRCWSCACCTWGAARHADVTRLSSGLSCELLQLVSAAGCGLQRHPLWVVARQLIAVAYAHDGGVFQPMREQVVEPGLAGVVQV